MARTSKHAAPQSSVHIALLRGLNVGGKNKLPMKELVPLFAAAGCEDVQTYIQSGNVVFKASSAVARRTPGFVADAITSQFGYRVPVVVTEAETLRQIAKENPFLKRGADPATLHVAFLAASPSAAKVRGLDPERSPGDEFLVSGNAIYLNCPGGFARTKLTNAYFDAKLGTTSTVRNWKTVLKLIELTER